ncbi:MAG TPA: ABC transporter permease [Vicinamibacterales bacterium]|nr:ABC transporter permease [Vicinamibacterales bacterium]
MLRQAIQDLRHGGRLLFASPAFTLAAVAALAIGIGANTAIFAVVNTLLIQPLPYKDPDRLAIVWEHNLPRDRRNNVVSPGNYLHWREMNTVFSEMSIVSMTFRAAYTGDGEPEEVKEQVVNATLFPMLGVNAAVGRVFTPEEDRPNSSRFVLLSDRFWRRRFAADPNVINRSIRLSGNPFTVVGVMPPGFSILDKNVDVWVPPGFTAESRTPQGRWTMVIARLKDGVTFKQAQDDMTRVASELTAMFPNFDTGWTARVVPLKEQLTGDVRPALLVLLGAVGFVLLIACANVANLLLAKATTRHRELAVRAALGADRARLIRQLLSESLLLSVIGGAAGLALAWWGLKFLRTVVAAMLPIQRLEFVGINGWVLLFACAAALGSGLLFGLIPAFTAAGTSLTDALREGGRTGTGRRGRRVRQGLVVVEIALALVLLVGAGLLVRSFQTLMRVNPGFDPSSTISMRVTLPLSGYQRDTQIVQFFDRLFERIGTLPGVQEAGGVSFLPLNGLGSATGFSIEGAEPPRAGEEPVSEVMVVTHDYFRAMGIPLLRGRLFDGRDTAPNTRRVIVSDALVKKYFGNRDPIGQRIVLSWYNQGPDEIVGVVGDVHSVSLELEPRGATYLPPARFAYPFMSVVVKTSTADVGLARSLVRAVHELDQNIPVSEVRSMSEVLEVSTTERRLTMALLMIFSVVALLLASVGIYGVISYSVTQRIQEIGIRMALGAQRRDLLRMVVGNAMVLAVVGIVLGTAGAFLLTRLMTRLLFNVQPQDPLTFTAVAILLACVAAVASYVPGRRATRVDPVVALRAE